MGGVAFGHGGSKDSCLLQTVAFLETALGMSGCS